MKQLKVKYLLLSIAINLIFAVIGGLLAGDAADTWYLSLNHPSFSPPMWGWYIVAGVYYMMTITLIYRLLSLKSPDKSSLWLAIGMIASNEAWNYLLFGLQSPLAAFIGLFPFTMIVILLWYKLGSVDRLASKMLLIYLVWLGFDFWWCYRLYALNP